MYCNADILRRHRVLAIYGVLLLQRSDASDCRVASTIGLRARFQAVTASGITVEHHLYVGRPFLPERRDRRW